MNNDLLQALIAALEVSSDNALLRKQVVQGLLEEARWDDVPQFALPLLQTDFRALGHLALAKAAHAAGDLPTARQHYATASKLDPLYVDETFEAELERAEPLRTMQDDFAGLGEFEATPSRVRAYSGPRVTFSDVGGMNALKEQIRMNIIYPFQHPEMFAAYGKKVGGGILMYGPPGCGKTYIARATAGELGASFYALQLNEVLSMWLGESEKHLNELFETARANAPSVIFIDEIDALGAKRSDIHSSPIRLTITQLLTEMDGIASQNSQLLVLGATNEPWNIDPAFRRPGRFDRVLFVPPPDAAARAEVLALQARGRKVDTQMPWKKVAERTEHYSGADLAGLLDRACEFALTDAMRSGQMRPVSLNDFQRALRDTRPSTLEWLRRAQNYVRYANQDGFYDTLAQYLQEKRV